MLEKESRWRSERESCQRKKVNGERESPAPKSHRAWAAPSQAAHHQFPPRTHCRKAVETETTSSAMSTITMSSSEILESLRLGFFVAADLSPSPSWDCTAGCLAAVCESIPKYTYTYHACLIIVGII